MMMARIDSATLVAYLDGELGRAAALRVEAALAGDVELQQRLDALKRVDHVLDAAFEPLLDSPLPPLALTGRPPLALAQPPSGARRSAQLAWAAGLAEWRGRWTGEPPILSCGKVAELYHRDWVSDTQATAALPHWQPKVRFGDGLVASLDWYRKAGWL